MIDLLLGRLRPIAIVVPLALATWMLAGCGYYLSGRPGIIERKVGRVDTNGGSHRNGIIATAADYRLVVFRGDNGSFCSEASPDAAAQLAQNFAAKVEGANKDSKLSAEAQLSLAITMVQLTRRTQGLQLFRDGAYEICNLRINGFIRDDQVVDQMNQLRETAERLILAEIPSLGPLSFSSTTAPVLPSFQLTSPKTDAGKENKGATKE